MSSRWRETGFRLFLYSSRSSNNTTLGSIDEGSTKTKVSSPFVLFKRQKKLCGTSVEFVVAHKSTNLMTNLVSSKRMQKICCFVLELPSIRSMPFVAGMNWQFNYCGVLSKKRTLGYIVLFLAKGHNKDSRGKFNNGHDYKTFPNWVKYHGHSSW